MNKLAVLCSMILSSAVWANNSMPLISIPVDAMYSEIDEADSYQLIDAEINGQLNVSPEPEKNEQTSDQKLSDTQKQYVHETFNKNHPPLPSRSELMLNAEDYEIWKMPKNREDVVNVRKASVPGYVDHRISVYKRLVQDNEFKNTEQDYLFDQPADDAVMIPNAAATFLR